MACSGAGTVVAVAHSGKEEPLLLWPALGLGDGIQKDQRRGRTLHLNL